MYKKIFSVFVFIIVFSMSFVFAAQGNGQSNGVGNEGGTQNPDAVYQQTQEQNRVQIQDGTHTSESGQMLEIQTQENNRVRLKVGGVSTECACEMKQEKVQNMTKLYVGLSNGKNAEIKVMPDVAAERALERLRLKVCSEENNCTIELKEVGNIDEEKQLAYEIQMQRHSKILGIFQKKMQVRAEVSAENGEVINVKKPWWAFIASEPAEE
ncbi:MAG: hypothetical protein WC533_01810 [Candidatus Pacearchaeota archaeon]